MFKIFFLCPSFFHHLHVKFPKLLMVYSLKVIIVKHNFTCFFIIFHMNLFSLWSLMVSFILELVARWQDLDIWFQLRMKKKSVIQDLGVRIQTAFVKRDLSARMWNMSFANKQKFTSFFSHGPSSAHFLHNFTRSRSG